MPLSLFIYNLHYLQLATWAPANHETFFLSYHISYVVAMRGPERVHLSTQCQCLNRYAGKLSKQTWNSTSQMSDMICHYRLTKSPWATTLPFYREGLNIRWPLTEKVQSIYWSIVNIDIFQKEVQNQRICQPVLQFHSVRGFPFQPNLQFYISNETYGICVPAYKIALDHDVSFLQRKPKHSVAFDWKKKNWS